MATGRAWDATEDVTAETPQLPPDIVTMRATAGRLLGPDGCPEALPPSAAEVDLLIQTMRGQLELLVPEVERMTGRAARTVAQYCAAACVGEARGKLRAEPLPGLSGAVAYARRLARVLGALCDHYERLSSS
ncbi:DUF6415 family natural product biosynthesis protein [Streptomyces sp. N50]|uniref:DUF6415 family natural product biosynthesis protein n=1 Tax=Streptomyces sp. N50 TaxID=3081765 RepID=UPI002961F07B|nr:DUF6415 family natural product biosynthesis protein [Streptomyces sp. N50]WOX09172.1 DUF6415 family natural product biosynthesis protein [Streptomyces sp. N50]